MVLASIISVIPPTVCFVLAVYVSFQGWKDRGIKIFVALLFVLTSYGIIQVIIQNQTDAKAVAYLVRYRTALWGLIAPLSFHTVIALMKEKIIKWKISLIYLYVLGGILILLSLSGFTIYIKYFFEWWGWYAVLDTASWFFWALHAYLVTGVIALIKTLIEIRQQTENFRIRKLAHAILINFIWGGTFTVLPYFILSLFKMPAEIFLSYAGNVAVFLIVFAIQKYKPEKFSTGSLLSSLIPLMPAESLIINPERKISWLSTDKLFFSGFSKKDLEGFSYDKLFADSSLIEEQMDKISVNHSYSTSFDIECYTRNGNVVHQKISISGLRNEYNDIIAYHVVFNKQMDNVDLLECLQTSYGLSAREKEVAALLINEYSNMQICDRLFISLNTVKTHTRKIYLKTNTSNRADFKSFYRSLAK